MTYGNSSFNRVTAVFNNRQQAEQAIADLRGMGVTDTDLSFIARQEGDMATAGHAGDVRGDAEDVGSGAGRGLAVGATAGALFGIAAALIPGVGPFITAGALATSLGSVAGGAVAGAIVGGTTGTLAGALSQAGYREDEATYYERHLNEGGVLVAVDLRQDAQRGQVIEVLRRHGGNIHETVA